MRRTFTDKEKQLFWTYFDIADEIYISESSHPSNPRTEGFPPLTLQDLDQRFVKQAGRAAREFGLSWPPYMPEAEEYALDHRKELQ